MKPLVSVVIPTYNGAAFLAEAVTSVWEQSLAPDEIVIVDDASTDDTLAQVQTLSRQSPIAIHYHRLTTNSGGPAKPINVGIAAATGSLIAVLDQDDVLLPHKLEEEVAVLAADDAVSVVAGGCARFRYPSQLLQLPEVIRDFGGSTTAPARVPGRAMLLSLMRHGNFVVGYPGFMFRKHHWQERGGVDERLRVASDFDLLCSLCLVGDAVFIPRIHYLRREHSHNLVRRLVDSDTDLVRIYTRYFEKERWLIEDPVLAARFRTEFRGGAYWLQRAGAYAAAWRLLCAQGRLLGWDWSTTLALAKLPIRWLWQRLTRRPTRYCSWLKRLPLADDPALANGPQPDRSETRLAARVT